ncbi:uncharacterized protein LOC144094073 [Amblyomma americanum]
MKKLPVGRGSRSTMDNLPLYPYEPLNREVRRLLGNPGPSVKGFFAGQGEVIEKRPASTPPSAKPKEASPAESFEEVEVADKQTETTAPRTRGAVSRPLPCGPHPSFSSASTMHRHRK